jgi:MoaA/NifB/PqqE/SkfB family radical SAM enzyme
MWLKDTQKLKPVEITKLTEGLNYLQKDWMFLITGGEPFLENNFVDICYEITKNHYISLNTNLSTQNIFDFADKIDPERTVFINAAVHIIEREKNDLELKLYIEKILYLQKKGFNIIAYYIAHPILFTRIKSDIEYLKSQGVQKVRIKIFRGIYNNKYYPAAYNSEEKIFLQSMEADYPEFGLLGKIPSFYGNLCQAGQKFFVMDRSGNLRRCSSLLKYYGNLFDKSIKYDIQTLPCPLRNCGAVYEGIRNGLPAKGKISPIDRLGVIEKYIRFKRVIKDPKKLIKLKERAIEYFSQHKGQD